MQGREAKPDNAAKAGTEVDKQLQLNKGCSRHVKEPRVPWARPGALYDATCFIQSSSSLRELSVAAVLSINIRESCATPAGGDGGSR